MKTILLIMTAFFLTGCGKSSDPYTPIKKLYRPSPDTDVTSSPDYNFSSFSGTVWKIKVKTAIAETKRYTGAPETLLLTPSRFDPKDTNYSSEPGVKIITVLPVGTVLRIGRLMRDNGAWGGVQVTATVEDGTNGQRTAFLDKLLLANNQFIERAPTSSTNWGVNPEMLEAAADDSAKVK